MALEEKFLEKLMDRRRFGMRPGLETSRALLEELGNPHEGLKYIHVAGTNGKGATCAILDSVLRAAGYTTGRYTSPHLVSISERFFLNGAPMPRVMLDAAADEVFPVVERLERERGIEVTFFECLTAIAFVLFKRSSPDVIILETGLGGRLDATNVVRGEDVLASVITRIGLDHCDWLGTTHAAIAEEKAGIIKPGRPVIAAPMPPAARETIARIASLNGSAFIDAEESVTFRGGRPLQFTTAMRNLPPVEFALFGGFQIENAMTAIATLDVLERCCGMHIQDFAVVRGLETVVWPGRCQKVEYEGVTFIVDGAHNPCGAMALKESIRYAKLPEPVAVIAGFCGDKDVLAHLRTMSAIATTGWAVPIRNARTLDSKSVAERMHMAGFTHTTACANLEEAIDAAVSWAHDTWGTVVICGSLFLAAEALVKLDAFPWPFEHEDQNELSIHDGEGSHAGSKEGR